jgi:hypothetical protein
MTDIDTLASLLAETGMEEDVSDIDAVREYREAKLDPELDAGDIMGYADAAIAELQDKLDRAQEYARIEVKRKGEAVERECAAIERAEKAEAEARRWEWVAKHTYVCPLGEMKPGEPGSYVIEVRPSDALLAHYEEAADA